MTQSKECTAEIPLIASIDVGTTSTRAILFNKTGQEVAKYQIEYSTTASKDKEAAESAGSLESPKSASSVISNGRLCKGMIFSAEGIAIEANEYVEIEELGEHDPTLRFPQPGWVECKPMNVLANVVQCFAATLLSTTKVNVERKANNLPPYVIKCIGVTNMRETTIVWSKSTGLPVVDYGIVWNDTRTMGIVNAKKAATKPAEMERLRAKTGLPLYSTYFSCSKLRWFLDNVPEVQTAYEKGDLMFGTVDAWLLYHLTQNNAFVSDVTNASRTGFMNLETLDYDDELLEYWGIDRNKINLPKIVPSAQYYGDFSVPKATRNKLTDAAWDILQDFSSRSIPIQGCLGDQSSSLVGQMAFKAGSAKCTYGTGCFLLYNTGTKKLISQHGALTTFGFWFPNLKGEESKPHFVLEGSVAVAGAVVQWLRDNLRLFPKAEDVGPLASRVPDSGGVVFVPAFSGLFAPYWDSDARGTIMGISQFTTASHIARAAIEGVCFQARAILKAMSSDAFSDEAAQDRDFLEEINDTGTYEHSPLSILAVDGGMSKSDEVMQIQADILGPCVKVRRSPTAECTALGAAIAANMAYADPNDRVWVDLEDAKKWVFYGGRDVEETTNSVTDEVAPALRIFSSRSIDNVRRKNWKRWEAAIERTKGWLSAAEGDQ